ncbi:MAG: glycoside hydrolase family 97 C-terminal domain-containing protein, partial [Prevotella sp.]|nr:glycoside hydrolase family 97 C-terminal domain-containing protein [Prevotella sp.]
LSVLFESPLLHWADKPESYLAQPRDVRDFMSALPTTWDETRLLGGYPGEWVVMARRSGSTWYVTGINGKDTAQTLSFDTSILPKGRYTLFTDKPGYKGELPANNPEPWIIKTWKGKAPSKMTCQPRGGFVYVVN